MSTSGDYPEIKQCYNQYCTNQTGLRQAKYSNSTILLCQTCYELYIRKKCCYFCAQVYKDDEQSFLDGKDWVQCDDSRCKKWTHIECEGEEIEQQLQSKYFKYQCPWCRIEKQQKKKYVKISHQIDSCDYSDQDQELQNLTSNKQISEDTTIQHFQTCLKKNNFLEDLLKKNGEFTQCINQEELQSDLNKLRSLIK